MIPKRNIIHTTISGLKIIVDKRKKLNGNIILKQLYDKDKERKVIANGQELLEALKSLEKLEI